MGEGSDPPDVRRHPSVVRTPSRLELSTGNSAWPSVYFEAVLLGDQILAYLVLAIGGALVFGNGLALLRPPRQVEDGELARAPVGRSVVMMLIGLVAAVWALGTLVAG